MQAATCQALHEFLNEEIECEEAIDWDDGDLDDDIREQAIKHKELRILKLNQLLDLVHAAYQESTM